MFLERKETRMSHEIETVGDTAFFATALTPAWHKLGTVVDHAMTAEEVLAEAHLAGWNVRKRPLTVALNETDTLLGEVTDLNVPRYEAVIRDNPVTLTTDVLGVVGLQYRPYQNEELAGLLNAIVDESGAHYETAGSLQGGRRIFVTMKLPESMTLNREGHDDTTDFYIAITNSHDGTSSLTMMTTPVRVVCANTLSMAFRQNSGIVRVRHTNNMGVTLSEIRRGLGLSFSYIDQFQQEAQQMIDRQMDEDYIRKIVDDIFQVEGDLSKRAETVRRAHAENVMSIYHHASTLDGVRGTAWGGFNAVTEYVDHHIKSANGEEGRATRSLFSSGVALREKAFAAFA